MIYSKLFSTAGITRIWKEKCENVALKVSTHISVSTPEKAKYSRRRRGVFADKSAAGTVFKGSNDFLDLFKSYTNVVQSCIVAGNNMFHVFVAETENLDVKFCSSAFHFEVFLSWTSASLPTAPAEAVLDCFQWSMFGQWFRRVFWPKSCSRQMKTNFLVLWLFQLHLSETKRPEVPTTRSARNVSFLHQF